MTKRFTFLETTDILATIPQYHTVFAFVVLWIAWSFAKRRYMSKNDYDEDELERKLESWNPEPLVADTPMDHPSLNLRKVTKQAGKRIIIDGKDCLNLATHNYLGLVENPEIEKKAIETVNKYGIGSCGPRGFYGTVDVHLELEERLAKFMEMEEAVVYSYGFSTVSSAVSAYCKRKDMVFVDEKVNFAIQKGLDASRSNIKYFKHNDVEDLERILKAQPGLNKKNTKNVETTRKFLIVEGIYANTGTLCPLPQLVALCRKYKLRFFVDESISVGTIGATGRGITEYFNVPRHEIDLIMGSLEKSIGSIGGFCVGSSFIIEHQRLSGLGYCFSASLPPLLTSAATKSIDIMEQEQNRFETLKQNCSAFHRGVEKIDGLECISFVESPVKHLYLKNKLDYDNEEKLLKDISDKCFENNLSVIVPPYLQTERERPRPSLRICLSSALTQSDLEFALKTLNKCTKEVLSA